MSGPAAVEGRLVLESEVVSGTIVVEDGVIVSVERSENDAAGPIIAPGFIDVHVHGWGGHSAMGGPDALDGMSRALVRRGVTSFLPTAWTEPLTTINEFAETVRAWIPSAPANGAAPLGFNLEGPFLAPARKGAHDPAHLLAPADVSLADIEPLVQDLRLITVAPELPGALELIGWLRDRGVAVSMGHSAATFDEARAGYAAGGTTTTHLFNAMTGVDHRAPGLAVAALTLDDAYVELIADGVHVAPALWPLIRRAKPADRILLVSDAIPLAGTGDGRATIGGLEVEIVGGRVTLVGTTTLAGSVIALDTAVRNLTANGASVSPAVAAASANPAAMLGVTDRGRIAVGLRADLVELDDDLVVRRVMRAGAWLGPGG